MRRGPRRASPTASRPRTRARRPPPEREARTGVDLLLGKGELRNVEQPREQQHRAGRQDDGAHTDHSGDHGHPSRASRRSPGRAALVLLDAERPRTAVGLRRSRTARRSRCSRTGSHRGRRTAGARPGRPARDETQVGDRPVQRGRGRQPLGRTRLGMAASAAGLNRPVPAPASSASATVAAKLSTRAMPRKAVPRLRPRRSGSSGATSGPPQRRTPARAPWPERGRRGG